MVFRVIFMVFTPFLHWLHLTGELSGSWECLLLRLLRVGALVVGLVHDGILRQLAHRCALQQLLDVFAAVGIDDGLGLEDNVQALDVLLHVEVLHSLRTAGAESHLEGAEVVDSHALRILQLQADGVGQLLQHGQDVGVLHGAVRLHDVSQLAGGDLYGVSGTSVPAAGVGGVSTVVLNQLIKNSHSCVFLSFLNG